MPAGRDSAANPSGISTGQPWVIPRQGIGLLRIASPPIQTAPPQQTRYAVPQHRRKLRHFAVFGRPQRKELRLDPIMENALRNSSAMEYWLHARRVERPRRRSAASREEPAVAGEKPVVTGEKPVASGEQPEDAVK